MVAFQPSPDGTLIFNGEAVANFVPQVVNIFRDAARGATSPPVALRVSFMIRGHTQRKSVDINYAHLDKFNFEAEFPGCVCSNSKGNSTRKLVVRYIREQIGQMLNTEAGGTYYADSGWYVQLEELRYVIGDQAIGPPMTEEFLIAPAVSRISLCYNSNLTSCESAEMLVRALSRHPNVTLPVFASTVFGSLRSVLRKEGLPAACILYISGNQGFGKTRTAKTFSALYHDDDGRLADVYDARSTEAAMRDALVNARDRIVLFDDVCKSTDARNQTARRNLAATLARAAANEVPITRMCGKIAEVVECRASLVITGEFPLETASDLTRCVMVNIDRQLTGGDDTDRIVVASALAGYLQWFAEHSNQELDRLRTEYRDFKAKERSHREERLQISLWELSWAFSSFLRFAVSIEAISQRVVEQMDASLTVTLGKIFNTTLAKLDKQKLRSLDTITTLIQAGIRGRGFPWFEHNGCLCVRSHDLTAYVAQVSDNPSLGVNEVTAKLREKGLLLMDETGKSTRKVNGIRVLTIPIERLNNQGGK